MSDQAPSKSKGKGKARVDFVDLALDVDVDVDGLSSASSSATVRAQLPSPVSPPRNADTRLPTTPTPSRLGLGLGLGAAPSPRTPLARAPSTFRPSHLSSTPSSSKPSPSQSCKRKATKQTVIDSFFPTKKPKLETLPAALTPEGKKALRDEEKRAQAEGKRLAKELDREEREAQKAAKKAILDAARAVKAEERRVKKEARDAETARKREVRRWKAWVLRHKDSYADFVIPEGENMYQNHVNFNGTDGTGLTRPEMQCLPHCKVKNPNEPPGQPPGDEYKPMRMFRKEDVRRLKYRKEAVLNGVAQDDEARLLREGERLFKLRKEKEEGDRGADG
ncbi:hypothetical protein BDV95DRAFT_242740 [Massariosphaeria phaeospora]|uniref:Uncharacterized protein n=1 Tax=Massariosphaeria phaeospora TaxID=100035 RepID=A0A7C8I3E0_9PLEO|nr:hypothetical protein BDV95DRAFT_242740 [Massariosphaeria phaeospora]